MDRRSIDELDSILDRILSDQPFPPESSVDEPYKPLLTKLVRLRKMHTQLKEYALALCNGQLHVPAPERDNYLAASLKQLQSQLIHLTWQTQCIAQGDYNQEIDFMGEFSEAFNQMILQLRERSHGMEAQRDVMMRVFDNIEPIFALDPQSTTILYANRMAKVRLHVEADMPIGRGDTPFLARLLAVPANAQPYELWDEGMNRWYNVDCTELPWDEGQRALLYHCMDITTLKQREESLILEANTDTLTGLLNRRAFQREFSSLWEKCMSFGQPLSLLVFDIDHFKNFNDNYGHIHGDECLAHFSAVLRRQIARQSDIIARYGGEEFIAILPQTLPEDALRLAEAVRKGTEQMPLLFCEDPSLDTGVTVSVGVACLIPNENYLPQDLFIAADRGLYEAKRHGRNCIYYTDIATGITQRL